MAHGLSNTLKWMARDNPVKPREKTDRDRSLRGKARVRARKTANKVRSAR